MSDECIIRLNRNGMPAVRGTRLTVYSIMDHYFAGAETEEIADFYRITKEESVGAVDYINSHMAELMPTYREMLERDAQANSASVTELLAETRANLNELRVELQGSREGPKMRRLLADVHAEGYLAAIAQVCRGPDWREVWEHIGVETLRFSDLRLDSTMTDAELWEFCQTNLLLLVTANRTASGANSLEITIRERNTPESLPVITLANLRLFRLHREYRERTAIGLLEILLDLDRLRGAGRLYIPSETKPT